MRRNVTFRIVVDPIRCDGFGHCAELAPELVTLDEWGYPILQAEALPQSDRELRRSALLAVRGCPRQALTVQKIIAAQS